ncbi:hypothetical protein [uncultured Paracoccus sp.]|uniref:hypothetical protein n=1 Tax=uncultured Paracoccus sp. TaxID=189685 RepID=UPI00263088CE|nr:hypothetical protein [uncultured Paracoccus sp.]
MLLSQIRRADGSIGTVIRNGTEAALLSGVTDLPDLARLAIRQGNSLTRQIARQPLGPALDLPGLRAEGRLLPVLTLPDPGRLQPSCAEGNGVHLAELFLFGPTGAGFRLGAALVLLGRGAPLPGPELQPEPLPVGQGALLRVLAGGQPRSEVRLVVNPTLKPLPAGKPGDGLIHSLTALSGLSLRPLRAGEAIAVEIDGFGLPLQISATSVPVLRPAAEPSGTGAG